VKMWLQLPTTQLPPPAVPPAATRLFSRHGYRAAS